MALFGALAKKDNLSDLVTVDTARVNLGGYARTVGAVGAGATSVAEYSVDGLNFMSVITMTAIAVAAIGDNENLAGGLLLYTFPAGPLIVNAATMSVGITKAETTTDTPDVGLGTVIGSGAVAVLGGTATFEDIITGQTAADTAGTATVATAAPALAIETADAHTAHFNFADGWADVDDESATVTGTVVLSWSRLPLT